MKTISPPALAAALLLTLTACGGTSGGDTTCGDFKAMSPGDQRSVIQDLLSSEGKSDPSNFEIGATRLSANAYCRTAGSDSSPIKNING